MSFTVAGIVKLRRWQGVQIILGLLAALILLAWIGTSSRSVYLCEGRKVRFRSTTMRNTKSLFRAPKTRCSRPRHSGAPHLERDEFNRIKAFLPSIRHVHAAKRRLFSYPSVLA